jgi:hypothetical protein
MRWTDLVTARRVPSKWKGTNQGSKESKGSKGNKGSKGIIIYITYLACIYNRMIAVMNDTSCIYM